MHVSPELFSQNIAGFLGPYYVLLAAINGGAALYVWLKLGNPRLALLWTALAAMFLIMAPFAGSGDPSVMPALPQGIRNAIDSISGPVTYTLGTTTLLVVLFVFRRFFVKPVVAWLGLNFMLLLMGLSMIDPDFASIVTKPDNVPIVGLIFLLGFFTWLATSKAVINDDRAAQGLPPAEKDASEKVLVWPDLVYTELICMILLTVLLIVWGILLKAPLEEPATNVKTPNPSKAPWYFLGLQEMLVYYDPWMAGVVLPGMVVAGLMAIPYLDFNKKGNGYYTISERRFAYVFFQIGFLELWITLIILGTFLRGPNWNFFGPFETWDSHKVLALNNVDLSQKFWVDWLGMEMPRAPQGSGILKQVPFILYRELPGIALVLGYFGLVPFVLAVTWMREFFIKMGFIRYMVLTNLLATMAALPIKMVLRWTFNLKYLIHIDEWFLNF